MKVHIHGNCQSLMVEKTLREAFPNWDITSFEVHADPIIKYNAEYQQAVKAADIILTQPVHNGYRGREDLSTDWVRASAKPGCEIVGIPAMHFEGHHPAYGNLRGLGNLCFDGLAAHLIVSGLSRQVTVELLLSEDLFDKAFVKSEIDRSVDEMRRREEADHIDIPLSHVAGSFTGNVQLFHLVNHPCRPLYVYLVNAVLDRLGIAGARVDFEGIDHQNIPHIPMLPSVMRGCGSPDGEFLKQWSIHQDNSFTIHQHGEMSRRECFEKMVEQLSQYSRETLQVAIDGAWRTKAFLERFMQSNPTVIELNNQYQ